MSEESNNKDKNPDLKKVEEPATTYNSEKTYSNIEDHPLFSKVIEKSKKDFKDGKGIPHEVVMKDLKEKFPFLR